MGSESGRAVKENAYAHFVLRYGPPAGEDGPVRFAEEVFGISLDEWQKRVLRAYGRGERRISIRACHGPGKTFLAAVMIWHSLLTRFPQHTVATAPSTGQLEGALVKEVLTLHTKLPPLLADLVEIKKNNITMRAAPSQSIFEARTARAEKPEALQGVHMDEGYVLLIADEASGVDEKIFEAAAGSMSGHNATTLLLSNPVRTTGFFYDTHHRNRSQWFTVKVGAEDSTRVSDDFVRYIAGQYGEDSSAFRVRVLGEFPLADEDTVIPMDWITSAQNRDIVVRPNLRTLWGVDVARGGSDSSALVIRSAMEAHGEILEWTGNDLMVSAGRIKAKWDATPPSERPEWILVDSIGLGAGVLDRLRELKLPARGINVSETAAVSNTYRNLRAELWFKAREWLGSKSVRLPKCPDGCQKDCLHERLAYELAGPRISYTSTGKILVESKDDMKKRGLKSPNIADAFVLTFAADVAGMVHGTKDSRSFATNWHEPIRRGRVVV